MKILCLQTSFNLLGGGARVDFEVLRALASQGHEIRVLMPSFNRSRTSFPPGVTIRFINARGLKIPQSLGLSYLPYLLCEIRKFQPDIIRDHSPYTFGVLSLMVKKLYNVPIVGCFHHPESGINNIITNYYILRHYSHIVTVSRFSALRLAEIDNYLANNVSIIYNGIDLDVDFILKVEDKKQWRKSRGLPLSDPIFCTAGSMVPRKNHLFLIDLMSAWVADGRPGVLVFVGDGEEKTSLIRAIKTKGLDERIFLWGHTKQEDYIRLLNSAAAFLFPSYMEGFGLAPAEALSCGVPALVSDRGALPEIVSDYKTGFILPIDQGVYPWIQAMHQLIDNPELRASMGQLAIIDIQDRFNWNTVGLTTEALYKKIVADNKRD